MKSTQQTFSEDWERLESRSRPGNFFWYNRVTGKIFQKKKNQSLYLSNLDTLRTRANRERRRDDLDTSGECDDKEEIRNEREEEYDGSFAFESSSFQTET